MEPEQRIAQLEEKMEDLLDMAEENNKLLRSMQRTMRWSFWGRLLVWIIVLALPFIVLGPFLKTLVPGLSGSDNKSLFGLPSQEQLKTLIDSYKGGESGSSSAAGK